MIRYLIGDMQSRARLRELRAARQNNANYNASIDVEKAKSPKDSIRKLRTILSTL
ncbi:MAG: hypothetical protein OEV70_16495 [Nitrospirota bacterium]|nr:hypothetical protein [Nitrospirota bacterium]